ncbi:MAG: c-type cytochrome [Planctomycetes bacterium]|nr:c-type cytochrome [Planctomycetota bacterium]
MILDRHQPMQSLIATAVLACTAVFSLAADLPQVQRPDLKIELVAEAPQIVTPIAMTVDPKGRILVVESATHFRPKDYAGPPHDRIRVLEDSDGDGKVDKFTTFYDQSDLTMGLKCGPDGYVYVATRSGMFKLRDTDGDGAADERIDLSHLETTANYPHNGMSGMAFDDAGHVFVGIGENLGQTYTLIGADGKTYKFDGEGGNIFRFDLDGKNLTHYATGFWNPFGLCMISHQRLLMIDNDPDSRPPCRLNHVVPGGDYGYSFRYGRSGLHPLQAWDGELPGTLPMLNGTGEAPTGIVYYDRYNMPADILGRVIVTSWGDHRVDSYPLTARGATFAAPLVPLVIGGEDFRPTGMTIAPDGSIYFGDWVDRNYTLHGKGRIWRLSSDTKLTFVKEPDPVPVTDAEKRANDLRASRDVPTLLAAMSDADPFTRQAAVYGLSQLPGLSDLSWSSLEAPQRLGVVEAMRLAHMDAHKVVPDALRDGSADVRLFAVRWMSDDKVKDMEPNLLAALADGNVMTSRLFSAYLAAIEWLETGKVTGKGESIDKYAVERLKDASSTPTIRAMALRVIDPNHGAVSLDLLSELAHGADKHLALEAVRTLCDKKDGGRFDVLMKIADDHAIAADVRAEAVVGLAADVDKFKGELEKLAGDSEGVVAAEAKRSLRTAPPDAADRPAITDVDGWLKVVSEGGDPETGRRVFFQPRLAACNRCHRIDGRGGEIGPELSVVGRRATPRWLLESILTPSREIAPQFVANVMTMKDGKTLMGIMLPQGGQNGKQTFVDPAGQRFTINTDDLTDRKLMDVSVMPMGLSAALTKEEMRDLVAYLMTLK